jgi:hypothetical protein
VCFPHVQVELGPDAQAGASNDTEGGTQGEEEEGEEREERVAARHPSGVVWVDEDGQPVEEDDSSFVSDVERLEEIQAGEEERFAVAEFRERLAYNLGWVRWPCRLFDTFLINHLKHI